jgi:type VI secretion system secreted protein Hcp
LSKVWLIPILFSILITSSFGNAFAAADYFLKIEGVDGESTDAKHKGQIEIDSFSWGVSNSGSMASGGGGGAGKATFQDLHFTKKVDKSSPKLMEAVATGEHLRSLELVVRKTGGDQMEYYKIELQNVLISGYSTTGSSGEAPSESISLNFEKIIFEYTPQNADGTAAAPLKAGYDLALAKKI